MQFKQLLTDNDAVSPVIGVILMVAITVILAAVIGTFVLGLGDQVSNTNPQASFTFNYDSSAGSATCGATQLGSDGDLTVTHDGGDEITGSQLFLTDGATKLAWETNSDADDNCGGASDVSAGNEVTVGAGNGDTVRMTWQSSDGSDTATLGKWEGPNA